METNYTPEAIIDLLYKIEITIQSHQFKIDKLQEMKAEVMTKIINTDTLLTSPIIQNTISMMSGETDEQLLAELDELEKPVSRGGKALIKPKAKGKGKVSVKSTKPTKIRGGGNCSSEIQEVKINKVLTLEDGVKLQIALKNLSTNQQKKQVMINQINFMKRQLIIKKHEINPNFKEKITNKITELNNSIITINETLCSLTTQINAITNPA